MLYDSYEYQAQQQQIDTLRREVDRLERANANLEYQLREKENRVSELEDALETMRRDLRYIQDGVYLSHAKRTGKSAIGGFW